MSFQYRILCSIHGYQYKWSDDIVSKCPINSSDIINSDFTCIVNQISFSRQITPLITQTSLPNLKIGNFYYDVNNMRVLSRIGFLSYCDVGVTSYTIEVYDRTNLRSLGKSTFSNTDDYKMNYIDIIWDQLTINALIEFFISVNSTILNKNVYVSKIVLYTY
jgi:hypothetical protein